MKTGKSERLERRGSATLVAVFAILILAILSGAMLVQSIQGQSERVAAIERHKATHNADAGVAHAVTNLTAGDENDIGSSQAPLAFSGGSYWAEVDDNGDGTYTVVSTASFGNELETIEAWLTPKGGGIYDNAIFAGNSLAALVRTTGFPRFEYQHLGTRRFGLSSHRPIDRRVRSGFPCRKDSCV